ncbi:MAG TPA: hypothetical protein VIW45_10360, partial [Vicinamibacterales bacterium]
MRVAQRPIDRCGRLCELRAGTDDCLFALLQHRGRARQRGEQARLNALADEQLFVRERCSENHVRARNQVIVGCPRRPREHADAGVEARHMDAHVRHMFESVIQRPPCLPAAVRGGPLLDTASCLLPRPLNDDRHGPFELREAGPACRGCLKEPS